MKTKQKSKFNLRKISQFSESNINNQSEMIREYLNFEPDFDGNPNELKIPYNM